MNLTEYLSRQNIEFERIEHTPSFSANSMAATLHVSGRDVAKTVALAVERHENEDARHQKFVVAVLPATKDVDLGAVAKIVDVQNVVLATEEELQARFPDCELGAVPVFGSQYGMTTAVDASLASSSEILFEGGTHSESIRMRYADFERLEKPVVGLIAKSSVESNCEPLHQNDQRSELAHEFLADHQHMSRLLDKVITLLEEGESAAARQIGKQLDVVAGPHVQFEEGDLYPRISGRAAESEYTRALYGEHRAAVEALKLLLETENPTTAERERIVKGLRTGVRHTEHCGALVGILDALPKPEQAISLTFLRECRDRKRPWTDLAR